MRFIICLCASALLACASQVASADEPVAPATAPAAAEPAATPAAEPAADAKTTPATTAETQTPATATEANPAAAPAKKEEVTQSSIDRKVAEAKKEYMEVEKDGQTLYCKREKKIGSRLPQYLCMNEAELINQVRTNEDMVDRGRLPKPCTSGTCSGS